MAYNVRDFVSEGDLSLSSVVPCADTMLSNGVYHPLYGKRAEHEGGKTTQDSSTVS